MGEDVLGRTNFNRFPERSLDLSARPLMLYRTPGGRTRDLVAAGWRLPLLRPAWVVYAPVRPWCSSSARPCSAAGERKERGCPPYSARLGRHGTHRGCRAGRQLQMRAAGPRRPPIVEGSPVSQAERCLSIPPGLTAKQTAEYGKPTRSISPAPPLKIRHLNVRSVTKHVDGINLLLLSERLDVLCLSETWLTEELDSSMLVFPGYAITRRDRSGRSGGGVAIIHSSSLTVEPLNVPGAGSSLESLWLQLTGRRQIVIGAIYRPPGEPPAPTIDDLPDQLVYAMAKGKPIYVLGDLNFDVLRPHKAGITSYTQLLSSLSLSQLITDATHPGPNPFLLDHIITVTQTSPPTRG